ncbi:hypothetical protein ACTGZQ_08085 [Streptococcus suis]
MSNRRNKCRLLCFLLLLFLAISCMFAYLSYQENSFQRAYEHGNTYEQLNSLMNTTRYVDVVRKAGYDVDDWGIKWNGRIDSLETHTTPVVKISVPQKDEIEIRMNINEEETIILNYDIKMNIKEVTYYKENEILDADEIPEEIYDSNVKFVEKAIESLLEDVYETMLSNQ